MSTPVGRKRRKKKPKTALTKKTSSSMEKPTSATAGSQNKSKRPSSSSTSSFRLPSVTPFLDKAYQQLEMIFKNSTPQSRRLVTTRQRQELYSLNQLMTRLEKEAFAKVHRVQVETDRQMCSTHCAQNIQMFNLQVCRERGYCESP